MSYLIVRMRGMSKRIPSREELLAMLQEAQKKGWPTDPIAEAFFEESIVSFWLEEFERCWKTYTCLAAYETIKEVSEAVGELRGKRDLLEQRGVLEDFEAAEEELKKASAFWIAGDEDSALNHVLAAQERLTKVLNVALEEEERAIKELRSKAKSLVNEIRQLEIPLVLDFDGDLEPYEKAMEEAEALYKKKNLKEARAKYEEIVRGLTELKEKAESKRKQILTGLGIGAVGVASLGLLYAHKKGLLKAPSLSLPFLGEEEAEEEEAEATE